MSKRARYDGPHLAVVIEWPPGEPYNREYVATVERGKQLPADAPAALRDALLKTEEWSEVADSSTSAEKTGDPKEGGKNG